jgi:hypothetical protein
MPDITDDLCKLAMIIMGRRSADNLRVDLVNHIAGHTPRLR